MDLDLGLLVFNSVCFLFLFAQKQRKRSFTVELADGSKRKLTYKQADLDLKRDQKSVLSSNGIWAQETATGWKESKKSK